MAKSGMISTPEEIRKMKRPQDRLMNAGVLLEHLYKRLLKTPPEEPTLMGYAKALGEPAEVLSAIRVRNFCVHDPNATTAKDATLAAEVLCSTANGYLTALARLRADAIAYNPAHRVFRFVFGILLVGGVLTEGFGLAGPLPTELQWFLGALGAFGIVSALVPALHSLGGFGAVRAYGPEILRGR